MRARIDPSPPLSPRPTIPQPLVVSLLRHTRCHTCPHLPRRVRGVARPRCVPRHRWFPSTSTCPGPAVPAVSGPTVPTAWVAYRCASSTIACVVFTEAVGVTCGVGVCVCVQVAKPAHGAMYAIPPSIPRRILLAGRQSLNYAQIGCIRLSCLHRLSESHQLFTLHPSSAQPLCAPPLANTCFRWTVLRCRERRPAVPAGCRRKSTS